MIKYMKYEIKGTYKFILGLILTVLIASTGLQLYVRNSLSNIYNSNIDPFRMSNLLVVVLVLVIFGAFITTLFYIIGSFRKELYEDRGYLTFSLPLTGKQILGSKLIIALMWYAILILSATIYNIVLGSIFFGGIITDQLKHLISILLDNFGTVLTFGLSSLIAGIITLLLVYFSITLSKVSVKNKKLGGLWFILFLILNSMISYVTLLIANSLPYNLDLNSLKLISSDSMFNQMGITATLSLMGPISGTGIMVPYSAGLYVNIASALFSILVAVGVFIGTSYLIENKIDI